MEGSKKNILRGFETLNENVLGIRETSKTDEFRDWMAEIRDGFQPKMPVLVLEAEWENRIDVEAAEKYFTQYDNVEFKIIPKQYHETILANPETVDVVKKFLKTK